MSPDFDTADALAPTPVPEPHAAAAARRLAVGAEPQPDGGAHLRVWAPDRRTVSVVIDDRDTPLTREEDGYFSGHVEAAHDGARYWFRLDDGDRLYPDPASRYQPDGPHGASTVVDPGRFAWTDAEWRGSVIEGQVIYELHVGTFTPEGTWTAARAQLDELQALGVTMIELMPVADFTGRFGWGYDGVNWFAPTRLYGTPDDLRAFVDRAHALGVSVILDVVYNHFGPEGNYTGAFSSHYVSTRYKNEWGDPLNFDGPQSHGMRELVLSNVQYWVEEFHVDGFRFDAAQQIFDASDDHILAAAARRARETAARAGRRVVMTAEMETQDGRLMRAQEQGGYGFDSGWNEDFHHSAVVALTGRREAYYTDYRGDPQELVSAAKWGYLFQGQHYTWQKQPRGTPALDCRPAQFVSFIENHDQVANTARGARLHEQTSMGRYRAMSAFLLLSPATPLLFQGQEFASTRPFLFFADHDGQLARDVRAGRANFLLQFPSLAQPDVQAALPDPSDPDVFARCKLDFGERTRHAPIYRLYRDLLALRRETPAFRAQQPRGVDGSVLGPDALVLRFFHPDGDRLVLLNLGRDVRLMPIADPLLAAPAGATWHLLWSSEEAHYGGNGAPPVALDDWRLPGHELRVLAPVPLASLDDSAEKAAAASPPTDAS